MSLQTLGAIAVAALCLGMLRSALRQFYAAYRIRGGTIITQRVRLPDMPVPDELTDMDAAAKHLGFLPVLTMQHRVVGQPKPATVWIYQHPEFNIEMGLNESPGDPPFWASLETSFADGALLVTTYPRGQTVETPRVMMRFCEHSLLEAFDHHVLTQMAWTELHGEEQPVPEDETALFAQSADVIKRHCEDLHGPVIRQGIGQGVAGIGYIFIIISVASQFVLESAFFNFSFIIAMALFFLVGLTLAVGGHGWKTRGKGPVAVDADKAPPVDPTLHPLNRPQRTM